MSTNSISFHRLKNLLGYEWAIDKRFYLLGTAGIFMISFGVFLTVWFNQYVGFTWRTVDYNSVFLSGFIFLSVLGISQSFVDLREKNTSIRYLTLPGSTMEKFIVQVLLRLILPLIIYPIVFWLGANLSVDVYYFIQHSFLENTALPVIHKVDVLYLYWTPNTNMQLVYWTIFKLTFSIPTLMFMGGIIFGKWNFIAMPATVGGIVLFLLGNYFLLSWLVNASAFGLGGNYAIRLDYPEVTAGLPLLVFVSTFLVGIAFFLMFVVTYFKLKEREV